MAGELRGWHPDPFGAHELRFFSDDGKPTLLVSDGGTTSHDRPPTSYFTPPARDPDAPSKPIYLQPSKPEFAEAATSSPRQPDAPLRPIYLQHPEFTGPATAEPLGRDRAYDPRVRA